MTLTRRFWRGYAAVSTATLHVATLAHYVYLQQTCTGWDCLGVDIYGRALVLGAVVIATFAAVGIALDHALELHYTKGESR